MNAIRQAARRCARAERQGKQVTFYTGFFESATLKHAAEWLAHNPALLEQFTAAWRGLSRRERHQRRVAGTKKAIRVDFR